MITKQTINRLLKLLEINGGDVHSKKRASLIIDLIIEMDSSYYGLIMRQSPQELETATIEHFKEADDLNVKHTSDLYITVSYHVYAGSSGDWHNKDEYHRFLLYHMVHGFKVHNLR